MDQLGAVQQKIPCVFETAVLDEQSSKRDQPYKVVAADVLKSCAVESDISTAQVTEKIDGTCVYFQVYQGKPWLWARMDRKPSKNAERRFKKFQSQQRQRNRQGEGHSEETFVWDHTKDFKDVPPTWIPASGVTITDGVAMPDDIGHTPGWVPVEVNSRQYCWHLMAVDLDQGLALVLREDCDSDLVLEAVPVSNLLGHTAELIGTNINGNPYGIGSKKLPLHFFVIHGSIKVMNPPALENVAIQKWFQNTEEGCVEGIVWHCKNKSLFKLHRNHLNLSWPGGQIPAFSRKKTKISVDIPDRDIDNPKSVFVQLSGLYGRSCDSLRHLENLITSRGNLQPEQEQDNT